MYAPSDTEMFRFPLKNPPRCAGGCVRRYSSPPRPSSVMKMPMLCSPGDTLMVVPVNFAVIWSKPRAVRPRSGHEMWKALTGGWWDVCSVR